MQVAGETWVGESAKARLRSGRLAIDLTRSDTAGNITTRGQVKLSISKFEGPGTYPAGPTSMFVTVAIDRASLTSTSGSEDAVTDTLKDALGGTKMQMLSQAEVIITSIDDAQVEGTFECTPGPGSPDPAITAGEFRALLK